MGKSAYLIAIISLLFLCSTVFAGGSGNCVQPIRTTTEYVGVGGAFEYNYLHSRMNNLDNKWGPKDMEVKNMHQVYGKVLLGLGDYVNLYGKIGSAVYKLKFIERTTDVEMDIDLENGLYTGAGLNALFPIAEFWNLSFGIGADLQGNFFINNVKDIMRGGENATGVGGTFYGIDGEESIYLTCKYEIEKFKTAIVPYIGGYHSGMLIGTSKALSYNTPQASDVDKKHFQPAFDLLSFGLLVGIDLDVAEYVNLNVEGRFIGETAVTTGATVKF